LYYNNRRVGFSEVGPDFKAKLTSILDYYQDICIAQSEELGIGAKALTNRGIGWVLSSWQVVVNRYPELYEEVIVGTAPYDFKGFLGSRNFILKTPDGEILSVANSIWSFIDIEKLTLTRIPEDVMGAYEKADKLEMDYAPRKIKLPEGMSKGEPIAAMYHNLDSNNHVNNAQYISMAEDVVPAGRRTRQMRAEYRASAHHGDLLIPYIHTTEDGSITTVSLANEEGSPYAIVEFSE